MDRLVVMLHNVWTVCKIIMSIDIALIVALIGIFLLKCIIDSIFDYFK